MQDRRPHAKGLRPMLSVVASHEAGRNYYWKCILKKLSGEGTRIKHSIRSELRERAFNEPIAPGQWLRCAPPWIKQIARREKNQRFQIVAARLERLNDHA